jgi:hypothetical protein
VVRGSEDFELVGRCKQSRVATPSEEAHEEATHIGEVRVALRERLTRLSEDCDPQSCQLGDCVHELPAVDGSVRGSDPPSEPPPTCGALGAVRGPSTMSGFPLVALCVFIGARWRRSTSAQSSAPLPGPSSPTRAPRTVRSHT